MSSGAQPLGTTSQMGPVHVPDPGISAWIRPCAASAWPRVAGLGPALPWPSSHSWITPCASSAQSLGSPIGWMKQLPHWLEVEHSWLRVHLSPAEAYEPFSGNTFNFIETKS